MNDVLKTLALALVLAAAAPMLAAQERSPAPRTADYIVAVVNQELVTAVEVEQRVTRLLEEARRTNLRLPPEPLLRRQVLDALIEERAIITHARDSGVQVDDSELDRAVASIAAQNQMTVPQLRERLARDGMDWGRFRAGVRDQILIERVREREVQSRIRVTDREIDEWLAAKQAQSAATAEYNIAQILVSVPENASEAVVQERRARAESALARVRGGEPFETVAREVSDDATSRERGGEFGLRPAERLPEVFLDAVRPLRPGEVAPALLRTGAGFHVLRLVERRDDAAFRLTQTRVRHILLRATPPTTTESASRRLQEFKRQIEAGTARFEDLAREHSEDGSAVRGGDLGWATAGSFVPEFEAAMDALPPGGISEPVASRFGVHLIQVLDRRRVELDAKQLREQARAALRSQKFEQAYEEWVRELRARAYIEMREPPG